MNHFSCDQVEQPDNDAINGFNHLTAKEQTGLFPQLKFKKITSNNDAVMQMSFLTRTMGSTKNAQNKSNESLGSPGTQFHQKHNKARKIKGAALSIKNADPIRFPNVAKEKKLCHF